MRMNRHVLGHDLKTKGLRLPTQEFVQKFLHLPAPASHLFSFGKPQFTVIFRKH